ncbi:MAG: PhzF family phenazine biosynthesis protein [Phenylobacterium sp.]|uniref:PhzF family phenazine biosynthesis protein n=1 Tax=Phenylobacterium sp. TaxID=1871053 RepID=UPI001A35DD17|nr:PhzF family phenazine biosynthesis protein [Phenylobacterium sp.]MBJ7411850.1 PhzF family phenazine biosynthesis protein [Phenylobacterium sp.]
MSGRTDVLIVNAFTSDGAGGNPAGVVLEADRYGAADKQAIAAAVGLSETAFVSASEVATLKLEFFTPTRQIAHCGHATIATFGILGAMGRLADGLHTKETIDGTRQVWVEGARAAMQQLAPRYGDVAAAPVLEALGAPPGTVDPRFRPVRVDTGNGFILVGLESARALAALTPDMPRLAALSEVHDLVGVYAFSTDAGPGFDATARMFAPRYGITEEAATGMAAGPLAALLHDRGDPRAAFAIEQGRFMARPSPSRLDARLILESAAIASVSVAGTAKLVQARSVSWRIAA